MGEPDPEEGGLGTDEELGGTGLPPLTLSLPLLLLSLMQGITVWC